MYNMDRENGGYHKIFEGMYLFCKRKDTREMRKRISGTIIAAGFIAATVFAGANGLTETQAACEHSLYYASPASTVKATVSENNTEDQTDHITLEDDAEDQTEDIISEDDTEDITSEDSYEDQSDDDGDSSDYDADDNDYEDDSDYDADDSDDDDQESVYIPKSTPTDAFYAGKSNTVTSYDSEEISTDEETTVGTTAEATTEEMTDKVKEDKKDETAGKDSDGQKKTGVKTGDDLSMKAAVAGMIISLGLAGSIVVNKRRK